MMPTLTSAYSLFKHDLMVAIRHPAELLQPLWFMALVVALFPLGVGTDEELLQTIAPAVIWIAALLASLLGLDQLFKKDDDNGVLEQWLFAPSGLTALVLGRVCAHWLLRGLPLVLFSPLLGVWLKLPDYGIATLALTLLLGTPTLSLFGSLGAALSLGTNSAGLLLSLLIAPLYVPTLIFATSAVSRILSGDDPRLQVLLLLAIMLFALSLVPLAIATALRIHLQE